MRSASATVVATSMLLSTVLLAAVVLSTPASAGPGSAKGWMGDDKDKGTCAKGSLWDWPIGEKPDHNNNGLICILEAGA